MPPKRQSTAKILSPPAKNQTKSQNKTAAKNLRESSDSDDEADESLPQLTKPSTSQQSQKQQQLNFELEKQQQLNLALQQKIQNLEAAQQAPKKPTQKKPKTQVTEELIQVVSIEYVVNSSKHPNFHLNGFIDRYPIEEIEGYGVDFQREDVCVA
jgi:hypothetical protein